MDDRPNPPAVPPSSDDDGVPIDTETKPEASARHPQPSGQALDAAAPSAPRRQRPARPWGFWATVGWTVLLLVTWYWLRFVLGSIGGISLIFIEPIVASAEGAASDLPMSILSAVVRTTMTVVMLAFIVLLSAVRRMPVRDYLALARPTPKATFGWLMGALLLTVVVDIIYRLGGVSPVTDYEVAMYTTTPAVLLLFAIAVLAPLLEETWWRGFVYRGIAASKTGPVAAVVLTAIPFTLMHTQYAWVHLPAIFVAGLFLAVVRWRTGSTVLAMFCHAAHNVFYFAATAMEVHWLGRSVSP